MRDWRLSAAARNHRGKLRSLNEDNFYLNGTWLSKAAMQRGGRYMHQNAEPFQVYAVCDGIGGELSGEQASIAVVESLGDLQAVGLGNMRESQLVATIGTLSSHVHGLTDCEECHTGTTLTACLWYNGHIRVLNVGDSRIYRLRTGKLTQLTTDHSEVQRMVDAGEMTPSQARVSPKRHLITQYIGMPPENPVFRPYVSPLLEVQPGDRYLLCSDGLIDMVEDEHIRQMLVKAKDAADAVDMLVQQALDNGGRDNVTALCLFVDGIGSAAWRARFSNAMGKLRGHSEEA